MPMSCPISRTRNRVPVPAWIRGPPRLFLVVSVQERGCGKATKSAERGARANHLHPAFLRGFARVWRHPPPPREISGPSRATHAGALSQSILARIARGGMAMGDRDDRMRPRLPIPYLDQPGSSPGPPA